MLVGAGTGRRRGVCRGILPRRGTLMGARIASIRNTVVVGALFLLPIGMLVLLAGKLVALMQDAARVFAPLFPVETLVGVIVLDLLAAAVLLGLCFAAGLIARRTTGTRIQQRLDSFLLSAIPGYGFLKGYGDSMREGEDLAQHFMPIVVNFDDHSQIAFEVERLDTGAVVVFLPGAPNPWSGSVVQVSADRVSPARMSVAEVMGAIRRFGQGAAAPGIGAGAGPRRA